MAQAVLSHVRSTQNHGPKEPVPLEASIRSGLKTQNRNVQPQDSTPCGSTGNGDAFRLMDLPLELRDLVWEHALPDNRVFHLHYIHMYPNDARSNDLPKYGHLKFHINHPPPVVSQIFTESRKAMWRAGCFLFQQPGNAPGVWFNPKKDVLYFDRNQRNALVAYAGKALVTVPCLDRVENVGLEWRWFLRDGSRLLEEYSSQEMRPQLARRMDALYAYMPLLKTIHYVLPMIRHQGGYPWGREPSSFKRLLIDLVDLPTETVIPIESGHRSWGQVQREFEKALSAQELIPEKEKSGRGSKYPPEIIGRRLLRVGAPIDMDYSQVNSTIRVFNY